MYGFAVQELNKDQTLGRLIYRQPLNSAEEVVALQEQLIEGDEKIERKSFYFPHVQQAVKVETAFLRVFALVKGFFLDLVTLPHRVYTYGEYKNELKKTLPIYQYLQNHQVPQKYLDQDRFTLIFYSGEKPAARYVQPGGLLRAIAGDKFNPAKFQGRNYQEYNYYHTDVYDGSRHSGYGMSLLTDENKERMRQTLVAS
ncbi:MAG: hypothetical protein WA678_00890 [Rhabdochlamydiaceae bacterium]